MARTVSLEDKVFASAGVRVNPDDDTSAGADLLTIIGGHVDAQGPYSSHVNFIEYRQDALLNAIEQSGFLEWSALTEYDDGAFCKVGQQVYQSSEPSNTNNDPSDPESPWDPVLLGNINDAVVTPTGSTTSQTIADWLSGSGSGLDADLLDGEDGSYYRDASNLNAGTVSDSLIEDATTSRRGVLEVADDGESETLVRDDRIMTPLRLARAFQQGNQDLSNPGFQKLPGGLIVQWGETGVTGENPQEFSYPIAFPTASLVIVGSDAGATYMNSETGGSVLVFHQISRSKFQAKLRSGNTDGNLFSWLAIGY